MKAKVDDIRLAALERIAMETWEEGDIAREGILDLCADLREARGLPPEQGVYPNDMTGGVPDPESPA